MDYLTLGAFLWLAVFVLIGLLRGFWRSFAALASLVLAYAGSIYFAKPVSQFLINLFAETNPSPTLFWAASATLLFVLIGLLSRLAIMMIGKALPIGNGLINKLGGGLVNSVYGALLGVFIVWSYAFVRDNVAAMRDEEGAPEPSQLVEFARRSVAQLVGWNVRHGGGSEAAAQLSAAVSERPAKVLQDVRATLHSPAFRQVVNSEDIQAAVRERRPEQLQETPEFQQFLASEGVQELRQTLAESGIQWTNEDIAAYTVAVGNNIESVRSDPEFVALYSDPEVQAFLSGEGRLTPSLMQKGQKLLQLISEKVDHAQQAPPDPDRQSLAPQAEDAR